MFSLKAIIFGLYGKPDKANDTNKDVNGKGSLERYNEAVAEDFDENILPLIDEFVQRTTNPMTMDAKFIPYMEQERGTPVFSERIDIRRKAVLYSAAYRRVKRSLRGLRLMFGIIKCRIEMVEYFEYGGFDRGLGFDRPRKRFDQSARRQYYTDFTLYVYSDQEFTPELDKEIRTIIEKCKPINAGLRNYFYYLTTDSDSDSDSDSSDSDGDGPQNPVIAQGAVDADQFTITWSDIPGSSGYLLEVARDQYFKNRVVDNKEVAYGLGTYTVTDIDSDTDYWVRLRSWNGSGPSAYSNVLSLRTD